MNPNMVKWLEALESGEYVQTRGWLREGNTFCAVGVAVDLYSRAAGIPWDAPGYKDRYSFEGHSATEPNGLLEWLGLTAKGENLVFKMNDDPDKLLTFSEIAARVRSNPDYYIYQDDDLANHDDCYSGCDVCAAKYYGD